MNVPLPLSWLPLIAIAVPLACVPLILLARHFPDVREGITLAGAGLLVVVVCLLAYGLSLGSVAELEIYGPIADLPLTLRVEPLGMLFALVAGFLWLVTSIYAIGYMRAHHEGNQTRFYVFFAIAIGATMGVAFAGDLITLFIFYEVLTLSTFPLVTHAQTDAARRAGRIYLGMLMGSSIGLFLVAIVITYVVAGTLDFRPGGILNGRIQPALAGLLLALYVFGIGKAAVMPMHRWLPAAMVAPTPVSALLHAVAVVKAGAFSVLKIATMIFGFDLVGSLTATTLLQAVAAFTVIAASLVALTKDNLKARLAYSTVSQLSYIVLAALIADPAAFLGGGFHIATHAFGKITLFFCAGAILVAAHKTEISQLDGLGRVMPLTFGAFLVGSFSLIGLPPFGGLWSKWMMIEGALDTQQWILVAVFATSTLLNIAYLLPIPFRAFFRPLPAGVSPRLQEAPAACLAAMAVTSGGCLVLFFMPDAIVALLAGALP
ncbi:MAG: proton-conducting transporter membrane subunit [Proteobacteria bacterium]|nr:proton-conducting transporter membrane subunit [Pseudomonadota bacterium]